MKTLRSKTGPFLERPYFPDGVIENTCADELRAVGLLPLSPEPIRIDRFIEKRFKVTPSYEELPEGVLGLTRFNQQGVSEVVVARALDEESSKVAERRIRTTLAHEGGHCLLHQRSDRRCQPRGTGHELVLLSGRENQHPVPGEVSRREWSLAAQKG